MWHITDTLHAIGAHDCCATHGFNPATPIGTAYGVIPARGRVDAFPRERFGITHRGGAGLRAIAIRPMASGVTP
ncbi:hypothetical protein ABIB15_002719 [Marisediminicola sp. UYEF4]